MKFLLCLFLVVSSAVSPLLAKSGADDELQQLLEEVWKYRLENYPEFATEVGVTQYDDRWTDRSLKAIEKRARDLDVPWNKLRAIPRGRLSNAMKLEFDLLKYTLETARSNREFPEDLLPISQMFGVMAEISNTIALMPRSTARDYANVLKRLQALPQVFDQLQILLKTGVAKGITFPQVAMQKAAIQIQELSKQSPSESALLIPFREFPNTFPEATRKTLVSQAEETYCKIVLPSLRRFSDFFQTEYVPHCRQETAWTKLPQGSKWYAVKVRESTTTSLSAEAIHQIGLSEVARIQVEMEKVKKAAGFEGSLEEFNRFLKTDPRFFYSSEAELIKDYRDIAKRIDPQLPLFFGKLPRLTYGVLPIPAHSAPAQPTAYYQPGSLRIGRAGVFFANTYNLKARPKWEMEALTLHEAVPGHHLQIALAEEAAGASELRRHQHYNAFVEGWGLYSESLGADLGLYQDPYSRYGQLTYEMWRSIRLVVDTGMHALGWSREKAIAYFKQHAGKSDHDIETEIDRYLVMPGQALGYKIGQLKILELRKQVQAKLGDKFSLRAFHDVVLANGALPLDILARKCLASF